ncbi:MAG: hypothetical protein Q4G36_08390 [Paracoccus sp. (in: a-proteobacteria)]|nr:hypothetical protein [Paracoccus sp. (in: a-proteobacteria)]
MSDRIPEARVKELLAIDKEFPEYAYVYFGKLQAALSQVVAERDRLRDVAARAARLATDLDRWITSHTSKDYDGITEAEQAQAFDDFERDWNGAGWGASSRDELIELREALKGNDDD